MKIRNKTRFVINIVETPRTVFSVKELKNNDLNIHITGGGRDYAATTLGELIEASEELKFEMCDKHISIHTNTKSQETNTIKRTQKFLNREESQCHITTGIKLDNLFVPILFRVCGDQSRERYELPEKCNAIHESLGAYEPQLNQLRIMILCSRRGTSFPKDEEHPSNIKEIHFNNFTLTVIWSYLNNPSHPQAIDFFITTNKETGPIPGFHWDEIYNLYTNLNMTHAQGYFRVTPTAENQEAH